jgi:hypothetical protein
MAWLDAFRRKGRLSGTVAIHGLPECVGLSVTVNPFRVSHAAAPQPYGGAPPGSAYTDEISIREDQDPADKPLVFAVERPVGYYYLDVGVIAYREVHGKLYAHVEHFFPHPTPCEVVADGECVVQLSVHWPSTPIEELPRYGTMYPQSGG